MARPRRVSPVDARFFFRCSIAPEVTLSLELGGGRSRCRGAISRPGDGGEFDLVGADDRFVEKRRKLDLDAVLLVVLEVVFVYPDSEAVENPVSTIADPESLAICVFERRKRDDMARLMLDTEPRVVWRLRGVDVNAGLLSEEFGVSIFVVAVVKVFAFEGRRWKAEVGAGNDWEMTKSAALVYDGDEGELMGIGVNWSSPKSWL